MILNLLKLFPRASVTVNRIRYSPASENVFVNLVTYSPTSSKVVISQFEVTAPDHRH